MYVLTRALGLLVVGNHGDAVVAEVRDWGGLSSRDLKRAFSFLMVAICLGVAGAMMASEFTSPADSVEIAQIPN